MSADDSSCHLPTITAALGMPGASLAVACNEIRRLRTGVASDDAVLSAQKELADTKAKYESVVNGLHRELRHALSRAEGAQRRIKKLRNKVLAAIQEDDDLVGWRTSTEDEL